MKKLFFIAVFLGIGAFVAVQFFGVKPEDVSAKLAETKTKMMKPIEDAKGAIGASEEATRRRIEEADSLADN